MASVLAYGSHSVASAVRSVTTMAVFCPFDTARLRLQVDEKKRSKTTPAVLLEISKKEGLLAPGRGWFPVISSLCCSSFVYFFTVMDQRSTFFYRKRSGGWVSCMSGECFAHASALGDKQQTGAAKGKSSK